MRAAIEFAIVGGGALVFLFWIIPVYIGGGSNLGLAPAMLPTVCVTVIGCLAGLQFLFSFFGRDGVREAQQRGHPRLAVALVGATVGSALLIGIADLAVAGAVLVTAAALLLGERNPIKLAALAGAGAGIMLLVKWSGL